MQSYEPRIIARGEWTQDENGDTTYIPAHRRPQTFRHDPAIVTGWGDLDHGLETNDAGAPQDASDDTPEGSPQDRNGYRIRSEAVWDRVRRDFLAGDTAAAVCDRHDVSLGAFKSRAAREGWRRSDQPDPEPVDLDAEPAVATDDLKTLVAQALVRIRRAVERGRAVEAGRWLRVHAQLTRLTGEAPPTPVRAPDTLDLVTIKMRAVGEIARAATGMDPDNEHGHALIGQLLDQLDAMPMTAEPAGAPSPVSAISDLSDPDLPPDPVEPPDPDQVTDDPGPDAALRPPVPGPRPPEAAPPPASPPPDEAPASPPW